MRRKGLAFAAAFILVLAAVNGVMVPTLLNASDAQQDWPAEVTGRFVLVDHNGKRVSEDTYKGRLRLMTFGYTYCPDVCPTGMSTMANAMDLLGEQAEQVVPIFVTVDPKRDTAEQLSGYVGAFHPSFVGLTGSEAMTEAAARNFRVAYMIHPPKDSADPDTYAVDHAAGYYIMSRSGQFLAKMGHAATSAEIAERLRHIMARGG